MAWKRTGAFEKPQRLLLYIHLYNSTDLSSESQHLHLGTFCLTAYLIVLCLPNPRICDVDATFDQYFKVIFASNPSHKKRINCAPLPIPGTRRQKPNHLGRTHLGCLRPLCHVDAEESGRTELLSVQSVFPRALDFASYSDDLPQCVMDSPHSLSFHHA
jgi:hypothetical protein